MVIESVVAEETILPDYVPDQPSMELLDYLGSLVDADGEFIGPDDFDEGETTDDEPRDTWVEIPPGELYRD